MKRQSHPVRGIEFPFAVILIATACCGCLFSGDRVFPTQQKVRCTVLSSQTSQPISGALVTSHFLPGYPDRPHVISKTDELEMDRTANQRRPNTGTTTQHGEVEIVCFTTSDPGWFFELGERWYDVTGNHWGFRVEAQDQREYFAVFPMRPGAVSVGPHFTLRIDVIGPPTERGKQ
jgi:hypothetical protein